MVWDSIWGTSCFYESKTEEAKRGEKLAIWPILCCRLSIPVVSIPPSSMFTLKIKTAHWLIFFNYGKYEFYLMMGSYDFFLFIFSTLAPTLCMLKRIEVFFSVGLYLHTRTFFLVHMYKIRSGVAHFMHLTSQSSINLMNGKQNIYRISLNNVQGQSLN